MEFEHFCSYLATLALSHSQWYFSNAKSLLTLREAKGHCHLSALPHIHTATIYTEVRVQQTWLKGSMDTAGVRVQQARLKVKQILQIMNVFFRFLY